MLFSLAFFVKELIQEGNWKNWQVFDFDFGTVSDNSAFQSFQEGDIFFSSCL